MKQNELKIEKKDPKEVKKQEEESNLPTFKTRLKLTEDQKTRIFDEIEAELKAIEDERTEQNLESKWESWENQYAGKMREVDNMQFNLHKHTTKVKVDAIVRSVTEAFFEGDKIFSVGARPEFEKQGGQEVLDKQEDFLDYKMDEVIPLRQEIPLVAHSAALKGCGILKLIYQITQRKRKRDEVYRGNPTPVQDPKTGEVVAIENKGLEEFLRAYPEAAEKYPNHVKALSEGKELNLVIEQTENVYHDPLPKFVELKDFFVRTNTNKLEGLRDAYCMAERKSYTYWELKREEKNENLYDVDELTYTKDESGEKKRIDKFANQNYELFEVIIYIKLDEEEKDDTPEDDTDDYIRCVFHIHREKKLILGSAYYPYYGVDTYYLPFYIKNKRKGFYDVGIAEELTDLNIAENAILNFTLEGAWTSNMITPIVKRDSETELQFLEKKWVHGLPIQVNAPGEIDFLNKYMKPSNTPELIQLVQYLVQEADDVSGISSLLTGRESPTDPTAPAAKTLALMERSGLNVKDYIRCFLPSFNEIANVVLQMYYQMNQEGVKYRVKPEAVVGENPFSVLTRAEMVAKTAIQSQALNFNFEKSNERKEDLALYQTIRQEPLIAGNPDSVYYLIKNLTKGWSPKWRKNVDKILPSLQEFQQKQLLVAVQAVNIWVQQTIKNAQVTGQPPEFDPRILIANMAQFMKEMVTPPSKEEVKAREKANAQ